MFTRYLVLCLISAAAAAPLLADPPATPAPAPPAQQSVLDGLVGKHPVIGFTERGGKRFLGRVLSGDHGLYVVQTFHYTSTPAPVTETTPQTTTQTTTPQTTYRTGQNRRLRRVTRRVKTQATTRKTIADAAAVRALLSGVAGPSFVPTEQPAEREIVAPADVTYLQELVPPVAATAAAPKATGGGWTMKTLWPAPTLPQPKTMPN